MFRRRKRAGSTSYRVLGEYIPPTLSYRALKLIIPESHRRSEELFSELHRLGLRSQRFAWIAPHPSAIPWNEPRHHGPQQTQVACDRASPWRAPQLEKA